MVCITSTEIWGGGLANISNQSVNYYVSHLLESFCIIGVDCFVLITGYFSFSVYTIKVRKIINLYALMVFYGFIFLCVSMITGHSIKGELLKVIFPFLFGRRWFVETYIILLFFIPFINIVLKQLNKNNFRLLLIIQISVFSLWYSFLPSSPILDNGYGILNFITLYLIGAYIRKWINIRECKTIFLWLILLFTTLGTTVLSLITERVWAYCFIANIVGAVVLFLILSKLEIGTSKTINQFSSHAFAVFLIHSDFIMNDILYHKILQCEKFYNSNWFLVHFIISIVSIYIICMLLDMIRQRIVMPKLTSFFDNKLVLNHVFVIEESNKC